MILVDTSIWIHHLHRPEPALVELLVRTQVCTHPMVIGELALGSLRDRAWVLELVTDLPGTPLATPAEMLLFAELHGLSGLGLSLADAHLLAALRLSSRDRLWTRERRLGQAPEDVGVAATWRADSVQPACRSVPGHGRGVLRDARPSAHPNAR